MRVLVTGAAGFLGRAFASHHCIDGDAVTGVDDMSNPFSHWPEEMRRNKIQQDIVKFLELFPNATFDLAYHFAAPVGGRVKIEEDPLFNADSLRIDAAFFRWAQGHVGTVIYPSSSAVYGVDLQRDKGRPLREEDFIPWDDVWHRPDEMYGFTKMAGEVLAHKASGYGLDTLCIRPFSGYGPGQSLEYPMPSIANRVLMHQDPVVVWGSGHQLRDFIYVDDIIEAVRHRLAAGVLGYQSLNIGSGIPTTFVEIARLAAEIEGYEPEIVTDPSKPEGVMARYADVSRLYQFYHPQTSLFVGVKMMLAWQKAAV